MAGELSGWDPDEMHKRRSVYSMKYHKDCQDPKVFQWRFGKQCLVSQDVCNRLDSVWEEDRWVLHKKMIRRRGSGTKQDQQLSDVILKNMSESGLSNGKLLPSSILLNSKDYHLRRRLGSGKQYKEIQWRGENFILRHFSADAEALILPKISQGLSLSHPNVMQFYCGFADEEKKDCFLVMELLNRDLSSHIREICGSKKRLPFSLPVVVDLMMQIARGMEYLHSKGIYHGELNPSNILVKARNSSTEGYLHAKVSGFGLSSSISVTPTTQLSQNEGQSFIWYAPEVLAEQEQTGDFANCKPTEKSDVYSFGMTCFQLLTGKVPFEDNHLQGDKVSRNIRAGERPLFPFHPPKYLANLTKRCWHADLSQRPSFSSICRILRYIKRFLLLNPDHSQPNSPNPMVDYCEMEASFLKKFPFWGNNNVFPLSQIPFQMFAYRAAEKEKERSNAGQKEVSKSGSEEMSTNGDESVVVDNPIPERKCLPRSSSAKRLTDLDDPILERMPRRSMSTKRLSEMDDTLSEKKSITPPQTGSPDDHFTGRTIFFKS